MASRKGNSRRAQPYKERLKYRRTNFKNVKGWRKTAQPKVINGRHQADPKNEIEPRHDGKPYDRSNPKYLKKPVV